MSNYKPEVFIGSSSEALDVAKIVKENIEKGIEEVNVKIWNEDTFSLNQSTLENILRNADTFDFGVFIFSPDDIAIIRDKKESASRDNVVFEQGLFLGRLGPRRSFVLCDKRVEHILSDYNGITISFYDSSSTLNLSESISKGCEDIIKAIKKGIETFEFSAFPSTALAIGYYENFLKKTLESMYDLDDIQVDGRMYKISEVELNVLIPEDLSMIGPIQLNRKLKQLIPFTIETKTRNYPFYLSAPKLLEREKLEMVDIPSALFTSKKVTNYILPDRAVSDNETKERMEAREIRNFKGTLELLLQKEFKEAFESGEIKIRWMSDAKGLFEQRKLES